MQTYSIVITRDRALRERLYEPHMQQDMVLDAPVLLTFCADFHRMRLWLELSEAKDGFDNFMSFMVAAIRRHTGRSKRGDGSRIQRPGYLLFG